MENETNSFKSESKLSFLECTGVIIGHGIGSGILSVPFIVAYNQWWVALIIVAIAFAINILLHLMVAELSYNNHGLQFIECLKATVFKGKAKTVLTIVAFALLGLSVIMNCCSYVLGSSSAIVGLFALGGVTFPLWGAMLIYYVFAASVVFFGMKVVGICEKYCVFGMIAVVIILTVAVLLAKLNPLPNSFYHFNNIVRLFSLVSFSLSSVMSVPTVIKGAGGDKKKIKGSIITGTAINACLILLFTVITLVCCGQSPSLRNGALIALSDQLGGWVAVVGYVFTILALSTSLWANTLNLRDMVHDQFSKLHVRICWVIVTIPIFAITLLCTLWSAINASFVSFTSVAAVIQVATSLAIVVGYGISRKKSGESPFLGRFGTIPFMVIVVLSSLIATIGSVLPITVA